MTKHERIIVLAVIISTVGFSFFGAINPVQAAKTSVVSEYTTIADTSVNTDDSSDADIQMDYFGNHHFSGNHSKMVEMLSSVLEVSSQDIEEALSSGAKPKELLASSGIYLRDLKEEFNFDLVGSSQLVRFR